MSKKNTPVARAIDVGYGRVKFTLEKNSKTNFDHFPSLAIASTGAEQLGIGARSRDTFLVPVVPEGETNSIIYEVGKEIGLATSGTDYGRAVRDDYLHTPVYNALIFGALSYMHDAGDRVINVLVLGLPVNQWTEKSRREYLEEKYSGIHQLGDGKTITVKEVIVQAQPMGGYINLALHAQEMEKQVTEQNALPVDLSRLAELDVLVVDPGEYTLDWLLVQKGNPHANASGAAGGAGRDRVVRAVMDAIKADLGRPLGPDIHARVNLALLKGEKIKLSGEMVDLSKYDPVVQATIKDPINQMLDGLGGKQETLDLIIVVGGHPEEYRKQLRKTFPMIPVVVPPDTIMANVSGFQYIAEAALADDQEN